MDRDRVHRFIPDHWVFLASVYEAIRLEDDIPQETIPTRVGRVASEGRWTSEHERSFTRAIAQLSLERRIEQWWGLHLPGASTAERSEFLPYVPTSMRLPGLYRVVRRTRGFIDEEHVYGAGRAVNGAGFVAYGSVAETLKNDKVS